MYVLPTVHISIGLEGNLAEACDVDGLRLQYLGPCQTNNKHHAYIVPPTHMYL